jgi:hypothetical protein
MKKDDMTLLKAALECPRCIVSVMGDHAGEGTDAIFDRKKTDIKRIGVTFWLMRSPKARPLQVQGICKTPPVYAIFIEPATKGGARPTTEDDAAIEYSNDRILWHKLPKGISPVTGKLDASTTSEKPWTFGITGRYWTFTNPSGSYLVVLPFALSART